MDDNNHSSNSMKNLQFVAQPVFNRGANSPCVARTMLQTRDLVQAFFLSEAIRQEIIDIAGQVMQRMIALEDIRERLAVQIRKECERLTLEGLQTQSGGRFANLPGVVNLNQDAESFLYNAKLALRDIAGLLVPFYGQKFGHRYDKMQRWAENEFGEADTFVRMLKNDGPWIEQIIDMRNAVEHPNDSRAPLTITNFQIVSQGEVKNVSPPTWFLKDDQPTSIAQDIETLAENLLTLFEDILTECLLRLEPGGSITILEIPIENRDPTCPKRLVIGITGPLLDALNKPPDK